MIGRPSLGLPPDEMHRRKLDQARDSKRRRREIRRTMADGAQLCSYGITKLCLGRAQPSGYCRHHERMMGVGL